MTPLRIAVTADLHYGPRHSAGARATHELVAHLADHPPDVLILAGDIGAGDEFDRCLALFDGLDCRKTLVPGNHDVWVRDADARGDSLAMYETHLPAISQAHGFTYLDNGPLLIPDADVAVVGSMNWYDYSWARELLQQATPDWEERLRTKRFTRGVHNDGNFVRWPLNDVTFTDRVVAKLTADLDAALAQVGRAIVVTHHPPVRGLLYPAQEPLRLDALLWQAFSGNERVEALLTKESSRVPLIFCGHTHAARACEFADTRGYNVGGDYHFKRLLTLDWPAGTVTATEFDGGG